MQSPTNKKVSTHLILLLFLSLLVLSGCAAKRPWGEPLQEQAAQQFLDTLASQSKESCTANWEADIQGIWTSRLGTKRFDGFIQTFLPSSFRFVSLNPLGQTIFGIYSDGRDFQVIDVLKNQYTHGSISSYALYNDIPMEFISEDWGYWLSGAFPPSALQKDYQVMMDVQQRGIWLIEQPQVGEDTFSPIHYRINPETRVIQEQRIYNQEGKLVATIRYDQHAMVGGCLQPEKIEVTDLPYGIEFGLEFSSINQAEIPGKKSLRLPVPPHFFVKYLP